MLRLIAESGCLALVPPIFATDELTAEFLLKHHCFPEVKESFYAITRRRRFPNPLLRALYAGKFRPA